MDIKSKDNKMAEINTSIKIIEMRIDRLDKAFIEGNKKELDRIENQINEERLMRIQNLK